LAARLAVVFFAVAGVDVRFEAVDFAARPDVLFLAVDVVLDAVDFVVLFFAAGDVVFDVDVFAVPDPLFFAAGDDVDERVDDVDFFAAEDLDDELGADLLAVVFLVGADAELVVRVVVAFAAVFLAVVVFGIFFSPET
jgi:hypothetical protein